MKCPKCNFDNDHDALFCEKCGAKLSSSSKVYKVSKKINRKLKISFFAIVGAICVCTIIIITIENRKLYNRYDEYNRSDDHNGLWNVVKNGKYGFVSDGWWHTEVIPPIYDGAGAFAYGLAPVKLYGKWGYIDEDGLIVLEFEYDDALSFSDGIAPVKRGDKWGYIRTDGSVKLPFIYDEALRFYESMAAVQIKGKWGFINLEGGVIVPCQYDDIDTSVFYDIINDVAVAYYFGGKGNHPACTRGDGGMFVLGNVIIKNGNRIIVKDWNEIKTIAPDSLAAVEPALLTTIIE